MLNFVRKLYLNTQILKFWKGDQQIHSENPLALIPLFNYYFLQLTGFDLCHHQRLRPINVILPILSQKKALAYYTTLKAGRVGMFHFYFSLQCCCPAYFAF